ncbi:hypothetical protein BDV93DRAFT_547604 [Ceratobasidium sp. AG-I]|nr:hypothetical protein BDV93DRAFT_547604 [Ceratobasidium sp. AG-I]
MLKLRLYRPTFTQNRRVLLSASFISALGLISFSFFCFSPTTWSQVSDFLPLTRPGVVSVPGTSLDDVPVPKLPQHHTIEGGRIAVTIGGRHPLHGLIADAEAKWNDMTESQSNTFDEAIEEYQRRYGRRPPHGFEKWYKFARSVNFKFIDEVGQFDQINRDITPLLVLPHSVLQQRLQEASKAEHTYHLDIRSGKAAVSGNLAHWPVASSFEELASGFAKDLPDTTIYVSGHDGGPTILTEDMRLAVNSVLEDGQRFTEKQLEKLEDYWRNPRQGLTNACLNDPRTFYASTLAAQNHTHTFIHDHRASMSFCTNPAILGDPTKRHGSFTYDHPHPRSASPFFVQSQLSAGGALLHPALQDYVSPELYVRKFGTPVPWQNRTSKVFWRGRSTGEIFNKEHDWRFSHRPRLHILASQNATLTDSNVAPEVELLVEEESSGAVRLETYSRNVLNKLYMDVEMIGEPIQCEAKADDHTCQEMEEGLRWGQTVGWETGLDSKFLLDVDGNGWSSRFQRLLASGAVIFKMTVFPEWNADWLVPYYHYIPIQTDYSDLYDSLAFFMGAPDGTSGHDSIAEKIGAHAREFSVRHWRFEDMQVYVYRLMLEYARVISEDREAMTMG